LVEHLFGNALKYCGDFERAERVLRRALTMRRKELARDPSDRTRLAVSATLSVLAEVAFCRRDVAAAERLFVEAISVVPTFWVPHLARLCLAATTRDQAYCHRVLDDLQRDIPGFLDDPAIGQCLAEDGQLHFVRTNTVLATRISFS
jgi:hypothetical protein